MSTLYIAEFATIGDSSKGVPQVAEVPPVTEQVVTFTTTTQSGAFNVKTRIVRITTDGICSIAFGANPTATTANMRMSAGQTEYFAIPNSLMGTCKVAAVTNT